MKKSALKKIVLFFMLCLYALGVIALGVIGGIGYTLYHGAYAVTAGVAVLGYMAFGKAKEYFDYLTS
jgi:uncharacterized membrane protein